MKDDLISRQAAIDALWRLQRALKIIDKSSGADIMIQGIQLALRKIERLPPAQPEQKVGKWRHYEGELSCSVCGSVFDDDIMDFTGDELPKHCPNCGSFNGGE